MQRHHNKREGVLALEGGLLPYVKKQFDWATEAYKRSVVRISSSTLFEVDYKKQTCLVDLVENHVVFIGGSLLESLVTMHMPNNGE